MWQRWKNQFRTKHSDSYFELPNFGFRVQADPGTRTKTDKTDKDGSDALFFALKRGECCLILGLGFRLTQARGQNPTKRTTTVAMLCFFCFEKGEMLPNFGFRVQADPGPRTKPDKTDNNGRDALFFALKRGKCCPILGLGFRLTQARGQKLTKLTKTVAMLCFSL